MNSVKATMQTTAQAMKPARIQPPRGQLKNQAGTAIALALLVVAQPAPASLIAAMDLGQLTRDAGRVVVGEVLSMRSEWSKGRRFIYTTIELQLAEVWKGEMPRGGRLTVVQPGGSVGDIEMHVHGLRAFQTGQRAVLFLSPGDPAWTVGLGQGHRPLRFDTLTRRWMVEPGDRSSVWRDPGDRTVTVAPTPEDGRVPLEDLRRLVRALVRP
jgi:hypothetical protein